jgi:hypothetical protein
MAPAVALLAGEVALAFLAGTLTATRKAWFLGISTAIAAVFVICGAAIVIEAPLRLHTETAIPVALLGITAVAAGALVLWDLRRPNARALAPVSLVLAAVAVYLAAGGVTLPAFDVVKSARPVCEQVGRLAGPGDEVASYAFWSWRAEYRYYLGRPITNIAGQEPLREAWRGPRRVVLLVEAERLDSARTVIGDVAPAIASRVGGRAIYVFTNR